MAPLLAAIRTRLPGALGVWLFGSLARGTAGLDSDIDLGVIANRPIDPVELFELGLSLGVIAGRDVDLVDLRRASVLLRHVVATEGVLVAALDAEACEEFVAATRALYGATRDEQQVVRAMRAGGGG